MITDRVSIMKMNPMKGRIRTVSVKKAITARVAPKLRDPVSPMKNLAGGMFDQRKAEVAPMISPQKVARM